MNEGETSQDEESTGASSAAPQNESDTTDDSGHNVQFYEDDQLLIDNILRFIGAGLGSGEAVVVIATEAHVRQLEERLEACGFDLARARSAGRYVVFDAARMLSGFMDGSRPDQARFTRLIGGLLTEAAAHAPRVRVFGEMVALLWQKGARAAAIRLEELWNDLAETQPFSLLCAYQLHAFASEPDAQGFLRICGKHTGVIPPETYTAIPDPEHRLRLITGLQEKAQRLDQTQAQLAAIVESSQDAIVGKTLDGIVTSWNHAAEILFGYTADEMIGQPISRLLPPERPDDVSRILKAIRRGERVEHYETERVRKDGQRVQVSLTVSPIKDSAGRIVGASKIARDITERKRVEAEREHLFRIAEQLRAQADGANRAKDQFLAMLGHELRNPLSTVRNSIMTARADRTRRERALDLADRGIEQLGRLVDDLLEVARITQGRITLRRETLPFAQVVVRAVESARSLIDARGHALSLLPGGSDLQVDGDPSRLEQVIVNLLSNAAKYMEVGGQISVTIEGEGDEAVLRVRDTGIGITPDMLPQIFELFVQAEQTIDRAQGGLGIGLTLVKRLVELHGGRVEAHSAGSGKGAEFVVRLPVIRAMQQTAGTNEGPAIDQATRARVLIVEDNASQAESMVMLLELLGHRVWAVGDGSSALAAAHANPPDVMLVDIGLPVMDGYTMARHIRQDDTLRGVTLIALTGYDRDEDRQRALAAGFDHHLVKPINIDKFQKLIAQVAATRGPVR